MRPWLLVALCTSCALGPDIIATVRIRDVDASAGRAEDGATDADGAFCSHADGLLLIDGDGGIVRLMVNANSGEAAAAGRAECFAEGALSATIDGHGTLWTIAADGTTWTSTATSFCRPVEIVEGLRTWTFVYRPERKAEALYALLDDTLVLIDTTSMSIVSKFPSAAYRWIVGNGHGELFGIQSDESWITVWKIDLDDGTSSGLVKLAYPQPGALSAVSLFRDQLIVASSNAVYALDLGGGAASLLFESTDGGAVDAIGASWCDSTK